MAVAVLRERKPYVTERKHFSLFLGSYSYDLSIPEYPGKKSFNIEDMNLYEMCVTLNLGSRNSH
jgi:hypothetical protein